MVGDLQLYFYSAYCCCASGNSAPTSSVVPIETYGNKNPKDFLNMIARCYSQVASS